MKTLNKTTKAYSEILKIMNKHRLLCNYDIDNFRMRSELHLFGIKLKEVYGFNIDPKEIHSLDWVDLGEHTKISWMGKKYKRTISWSDSGEQPNDELLLLIKFPTGAYIFGDDYPTDLFHKFFRDLVNFKPKYTDFHNSTLYFSMDNAGSVYSEFKLLYNKYQELNKEDYIRRQIKKMEQELEMLKKPKP